MMPAMKTLMAGVLALFLAAPLCGQGLTIMMKEVGPAGQTSPSMQIDKTKARLDVPSLLSQFLYDADTKTLRLLVPLTKTYKEYTPASVQAAAAANRGQAAEPAKITYKRTGTSKVKDWTCTTYDGLRGAEKVVELCAAEGSTIGLARADFTLVQQAVDLMRGVVTSDLADRVPIYGTVENQGYLGFPVRRISFREGKPDITAELVDIKREPIPPATFALPAGFNKVP
jgi:hypothetical protein